MKIQRVILLTPLLFGAALLHAEVSLAPLFRDGAVFQRDMPLPVWGKANSGEKVIVEFGSQKMETVADDTGNWSVMLAPLTANSNPADLTVKGDNEIRVSDILVGEVWLCSGQSNMNWAVKLAANPEQEIASANNPLIRYFGVQNEVEDEPQTDTIGEWYVASPEHVSEFSAVAYYFAKALQPHLGVPVGIIKATPGGSSIEAWMSEEALKTLPEYEEIQSRRAKVLAEFPQKQIEYQEALEKWNAASEAAQAAGNPFSESKPRVPEGPKSRNAPSGLYNANVYPLVPYGIRGFLWYQGEANASRYEAYRTLFPTMIEQWRNDFRQEDAPFFFVQLANFDLKNDTTKRQWAFQRESQASVLSLPNTAMALAIDIGDPGDIHPRNKQEVGRRLSLLARELVYGQKITGQPPQAVEFSAVDGAMHIKLSHADGLYLRDDTATDIEIAGEDQKFHPAELKVDGSTLIVSSTAVPLPVAVRYLWHNAPQACLFNGEGLPVAPFRSDDWK